MTPPPRGTERKAESREEFMREVMSDINPLKHVGEGWYDTDEYARPADIGDLYTRGDILGAGEYYPGPAKPEEKWPPHRRGR